DRNRSHWSTSKTPSYTKSVSWQHHPEILETKLPEKEANRMTKKTLFSPEVRQRAVQCFVE
ncbi:hypothetical protein R9J47_00105, partial [Escherichia coli]